MGTFRLNFCAMAMACLFAILPVACAEPTSYITENLESNFYPNGTLSLPIEARGYVEVAVSDTTDVLQYVRLYLSGTGNTNLLSTDAYRAVAASPTMGSRTIMYVNTTRDSEDFSYNITSYASAPVIYLNLTYVNDAGGMDIYSGSGNMFSFSMRITSSQSIASANLSFGVALDTLGGADSMVLSNPSATVGSACLQDSDSDGQMDTVSWNGFVPSPGGVTVSFNGSVAPGTNFDEANLFVDIGEGVQTYASSALGTTFTGITFTDRFTRGPVREGVEMLLGTPTIVRGYMRNIATGLTYIVNNWGIYRVGDFSSSLMSGTPSQPVLAPSHEVYTDWYNTGGNEKSLYFAALFDWEVQWGPSVYTSNTVAYMDMPVLYEIDISPYNDIITLLSNMESGRSVSINESVKHTGHANLHSGRFQAEIVPPSGWTVDTGSVMVYYSNQSTGGGVYDITSLATVYASGSNVTVNVSNLPSIIGRNMGENDDIIFSYTENGPSATESNDYDFSTRFTFWTLSLTPVTEFLSKQTTIAGTSQQEVQPSPGGGAGTPVPVAGARPFADFIREKAEIILISENYASITARSRVTDTGDNGITGISVIIYVPDKSGVNLNEITATVYRKNGNVELLQNNAGLKITEKGMEKIGGITYKSYLLEKATDKDPLTKDTLDLMDGDSIEIRYKATLPLGTHRILTRVFGYNYYDNKIIFDDAYTPIRIAKRIAGIGSIEIQESEFVQGVAFVDQPVKWIKTVEVYNPNAISVQYTFSVLVFEDALNANLIGGGKKSLKMAKNGTAFATWSDEIKAGAKKTYFIEAVTPPVIETSETIDVIGHNRELATFMLNATLENTALTDYSNVSFLMRVSGNKIAEVRDEGGNRITNIINRSAGESVVILPFFRSGEKKKLVMIYNEIPPTMVIKPDRFMYTIRNAPVNISVIIVLADPMETVNLEVEVLSPKPDMETVYLDVTPFNILAADRVIRNYYSFTLPYSPPGEYMITAKLKRGAVTILSSYEKFFIITSEQPAQGIHPLFVVIVAVIISGLLFVRKYKEEKYTEAIDEIKKKIKKIR